MTRDQVLELVLAGLVLAAIARRSSERVRRALELALGVLVLALLLAWSIVGLEAPA